MRVLVVGGAGYIGSHMVKLLLRCGYEVVTFDDLSSGHREAVIGGEFVQGTLGDREALDLLFIQHNFQAVMHFASFIQVGESVTDPAKYYRNNVANTLNLLDAMIEHGVKQFIFSSSAAIFGNPSYNPIDESHPRQPINPYGTTKLMVEEILRDYDRAYGLRSICLRYFNAAGADPDGSLGERHDPETHLIPLVLKTASAQRPAITINGTDYDTPDGTCIRDYVHVVDLCDAHLLALVRLNQNGVSDSFNLGTQCGYSVRQVIDVAKLVTCKPIAVECGPRRSGDAATLVASSEKARNLLGWNPQFEDLHSIIAHVWNWERISSPNTCAMPRTPR